MEAPALRYEVVRTLGGSSFTDVALVLRRSTSVTHRFGARHHHADDDTVVLHHRVFRPVAELAELEAYAAQLEIAAANAARGQLWYFVTTRPHADGTVEVTLFDRWFDGRQVHCEQRAHGEFDSSDEASSAASIEFAATLQAWAEHQNDGREARCRELGGDELLEAEQAAQALTGARELASLLAGLGRREDLPGAPGAPVSR
jgi:hypothetical protein